jgi:hypothetical protein
MKKGICFLVKVDKSNSLSVSLVLPRAFLNYGVHFCITNIFKQVNKHFPRVCRVRGQGHPVCVPAGGITVPAGTLVVGKGPKTFFKHSTFLLAEPS